MDNTHLETLLGAVFEAATSPDDANSIMPGGCSRAWHTTALLTAVSRAARACRVAAPAVAAAEEKEARRNRPQVGLDPGDVGVQHRDSTTFLIAAQPFYAFNHVLENVSPVLKQAMEGAGDIQEPIALPLAIDAPVDRHHALFGLAVEFAYTGAISRLSDDNALPLYTLAEFLQIDALCSYVLNTRMQSHMQADVGYAERVLAAATPFPVLQEAAIVAFVAHLSRKHVPEDNVCSMLRRCRDACSIQPSPAPGNDWEPRVLLQVSSLFARTMRSLLRARAAAAVVAPADAAAE